MKKATINRGYTFCLWKKESYRIEGGTKVKFEEPEKIFSGCKIKIHTEEVSFSIPREDFMIMFDVA